LKTPSAQNYSLHLTGQQGNVMKESMHCAKTLAWNLLPSSVKKSIKTDWDKNGHWGLHIHCPEGATPKDGPSAGCAITIAIISRMCGIAVRNDMALTGEVDLSGNVCEVGGISSKIDGAVKAGVSTILIPKDNKEDYDKYMEKQTELMSSSSDSLNSMDTADINIILVSRIEEIIDEIFVKKIKITNIC
jgi:ATP-dependent Lon protease